MAFDIASLRNKASEYRGDPMRVLRDAVTGSGILQKLGLVLIPLWLTPSRYRTYLQSHGKFGRVEIWVAAGLWVAAMNLMLSPAVKIVEAALTRMGTAAGYWDAAFTTAGAPMVLAACSCVLFLGIAAMRAAVSWIAFAIDRTIGDGTVNPPPFGYYAVQTAGEICVVSVLICALFYAVRPLNAPVWTWFAAEGAAQTSTIVILAAVIFGCTHIKRQTQAIAATEIYGGVWKAVAYDLGIPMTALFALWLLSTA